MPLVVVVDGIEVAVAHTPVRIGAAADADVRVAGAHVSEVHLVVEWDGQDWALRHVTGSPAWIEGRPLRRAVVDRPARVRLGHRDHGPVVELRLGSGSRAATQILNLQPKSLEPPSREVRSEGGDGLELGRFSGVLPALQTKTRIGRAAENDIVIDDLLVSRHHAEMNVRPDGRVEIVDLGGPNGTFVNGRRVQTALLEELDVVTVGRNAFRFADGRLERYLDEGEVSFTALALTVMAADGKTLVDDVTVPLDRSSFLAIVGPSGSGKSSLLNALTGQRPADSGAVLYGGRDLYADYEDLRTRIGIVPQADLVYPQLTVRQALGYQAELRFAADVEPSERERRVEEVMEELGLAAVADTRVGELSGGQRRRVSVARELLTKPTLLFLDEPASGLDPGYERSLMDLLRALADGGRTVVVVTHSVQSLRLCDRVLFLAPGGRPAYFGPAQFAPAYFGVGDLNEVFRELTQRSEYDWGGRFRSHRDHDQYIASRLPRERPPASPRRRLPALISPRSWTSQLWMLVRRYMRVLTSDRRNLALLAFQPLLLGALMLAALPGGELAEAPKDEVRLVSRAGLVLLIVVLGATWLGASNAIREIVKERPLFERERRAGLSASAYVWSKALVLGALTLLQTAVLTVVAVADQGGPIEGSLLGWPLGELILACGLAGLAGMSLGLLISAVARSVDRAMTVLPVVLIVEMLLAMGGVFPDVVDKPVLREASYAASTQWAFSATASTADLERLQSVDRLVRDIPTVRVDDPLPVLRAVSESQRTGEPRWRHDWPTWLGNAGVLLGLTLAGLLGAIALLASGRAGG